MADIKAILWDIDGTLLNFDAAEKAAIRACFAQFGLGECTDAMLLDYVRINKGYWAQIERGEIDKKRALVARFEDFFTKEGLPADRASSFNDLYQVRLGDTVVFNHGGYDAVCSLRGHVKQYAVSNGTRVAQRRKLKNSGLAALLDGVFISEEVGAEKPDPAFFDYVFAHIGEAREEAVIIGDSLTSDMLGGNNAGIRCWWYNPLQRAGKGTLRIDGELRSLSDIWTLWAHEPLAPPSGQEDRPAAPEPRGLCRSRCSPGALYTMEYDAAHSGAFAAHIRGKLCQTEEDFFREVSSALRFPHYFGWSWAALDECLRDLDWLAFSRLLIVIDDYGDVLRDAARSRNALEAVLQKAVDYWTEHGVPVAVLLNEKARG